MTHMNNMQKIFCSELGDNIFTQAEEHFRAKGSSVIIFNRFDRRFEYLKRILSADSDVAPIYSLIPVDDERLQSEAQSLFFENNSGSYCIIDDNGDRRCISIFLDIRGFSALVKQHIGTKDDKKYFSFIHSRIFFQGRNY